MHNHSPWIAQLNRTRPIEPLSENLSTDVCIVGGGIAGVSTAYFLLTQTDKKVLLLEAGKIAHGATGHNAGQITSYFEESLTELVKRFGLELAGSAQKVIEEDARVLLNSIINFAKLEISKSEFVGHDGWTTLLQIQGHLNDLIIKKKAGLTIHPMLLAKEWSETEKITTVSEYVDLYTIVPHKEILTLLETTDQSFIAAHPFLSGCMNSALFCEELVGYLLTEFKDRFLIKEHTPVSSITVDKEVVTLTAGLNTVSAYEVVLATNGFESIKIFSSLGSTLDAKFHHEVMGEVGYMIAYKEKLDKAPFASIYTHEHATEDNPYFYVTRRPFDINSDKYNLICVGGPQHFLPDRATYDFNAFFPEGVKDELEGFATRSFDKKNLDTAFHWHGLMGYTKSKVRLIGREPKAPRLLYNLGCNGVGILTSIYGAERISKIIKGDNVEPTIFDPK
jgi:glycine/D-amino acid oxidase-like deaminating enzyme